jgi:hypothetical protein
MTSNDFLDLIHFQVKKLENQTAAETRNECCKALVFGAWSLGNGLVEMRHINLLEIRQLC